MYERMLDKQHKPTMEEFADYCGEGKELFRYVDAYLTDELKTEAILRFPYGNGYGWGIKYSIKNKLICDLFAEKNAFTVMLRLTNKQYEAVYNELTDYTKKIIDEKYPCGEGGWIHYRVLTQQHAEDIKQLVLQKVKKKN